MKLIKEYTDFLSEGAYLNDQGALVLSYKDDDKNNNEVLKTKSGNILIPYNTKNDPQNKYRFPIYYSLGVEDYSGNLDHPGRFKYTMDLIKNGRIAKGDLTDFLKKSLTNLGLSLNKVSYVVGVGSSRGLVGKMINSISEISNAKPLNLNKVDYLNIGKAINYKELQRQRDTQLRGEQTFNSFKEEIIRKYINVDQSEPEMIQHIRDAESIENLEKLLSRKHRYVLMPDIVYKNEEELRGMINQIKPFHVKSSGVDRPGLSMRKMFHDKYDFEETQFKEAVKDCIKGWNKEMIIVDDNRNTGIDIKRIVKYLEDTAKEMGIEERDWEWKTRFKFFVMYNMGKPSTYFKYKDMQTGKYKKTFSNNNRDVTSFRRAMEWDQEVAEGQSFIISSFEKLFEEYNNQSKHKNFKKFVNDKARGAKFLSKNILNAFRKEGLETAEMASVFNRHLRKKLNLKNRKDNPTKEELRIALTQLKDIPKLLPFVAVMLAAPIPGSSTMYTVFAYFLKKKSGGKINLLPDSFDNILNKKDTNPED